MNVIATLRFLLPTALAAAALPTLAQGPLAAGHDDATYGASVTAAPEAELKALDDTVAYSVSRAYDGESTDRQSREPERVSLRAQVKPHSMMGACCRSGSPHDRESKP